MADRVVSIRKGYRRSIQFPDGSGNLKQEPSVQVAVGDRIIVQPVGWTPTPEPEPEPVPPPPPPSGATYPPDTTNYLYVATPSVAVPSIGTVYSDPNFGTKIRRVGGSHHYSRIQVWNSDETLLYLYGTKQLLNGTTYAFVKNANPPFGEIWSNVTPNLMFGVTGGTNRFVSFNTTTLALTTEHTFTGYTGVTVGQSEGTISDDDSFTAIQAEAGTGAGFKTVIGYNIANDTIEGQRTFTTAPNWCSVSRSGQYILVGWGTNGTGATSGIDLYTRNMQTLIRKVSTLASHSDPGYNAAGNDVLAQAGDGRLPLYNLDTGTSLYMLPNASAATYGLARGHVSCRNMDRNGWAYFSCQESISTNPGNDQVAAVKMDGSGTLEVFGHTHHVGAVYNQMPKAVPNRDGSRVFFTSEWGTSGPMGFVASAA